MALEYRPLVQTMNLLYAQDAVYELHAACRTDSIALSHTDGLVVAPNLE